MNMNTSPAEPQLTRKSLLELFKYVPLQIPEYQRSYSWQSSHVLDLLHDLHGRAAATQEDGQGLLLGTVILHNRDGCHDIVDGQQRLTTLTILLHEFGSASAIPLPLLNAQFADRSATVIRNTQKLIREFLQTTTAADKDSLRQYVCQKLFFHVLEVSGEDSEALDLAFTFFDSVNSKGKPLSDFDLLKAHHLMFIPACEECEPLAAQHNEQWLQRDDRHSHLFSTILRRIRMWSRGQDRDPKRERPDYNEFCSVVQPEEVTDAERVFNRYMQPVFFRSWRRVGGRIVLTMDSPPSRVEALIPTAITQTFEGGDPFFLYAERYHGRYDTLFSEGNRDQDAAARFVRQLANHIANDYLQDAFRAVMLLYCDKFGEDRLIEASVCVERIISDWRWQAGSVRIEGTLDHVNSFRLIPILLESVHASHAVSQLFALAKRLLPPPVKMTGVKKRYCDSLKQFYDQNRDQIPPSRTRELPDCLLSTTTN